jgi:hypothetical protein
MFFHSKTGRAVVALAGDIDPIIAVIVGDQDTEGTFLSVDEVSIRRGVNLVFFVSCVRLNCADCRPGLGVPV